GVIDATHRERHFLAGRVVLRVCGEGAAGTFDRAVTIVLDIVPVGSRAIRADHARASPDDTRILVVDQLTDQFPRRLQFAGEAGDLGGGVSTTVRAAGVVEHRSGQGNALTYHRSPPRTSPPAASPACMPTAGD